MMKRNHYHPLELAWAGLVVVLLFIITLGISARGLPDAHSGSPDSSSQTVLTVVSSFGNVHGGEQTLVRTYTAEDGVRSTIATKEERILDTLYPFTTWERFVLRIWDMYAISWLTGRPVLVYGQRIGDIAVFTQSSLGSSTQHSLPKGVATLHLPASLLHLSLLGEPISALRGSEREDFAFGQGLYGEPDAPSTLLVLPRQDTSPLLQLIAGLLVPRMRPFLHGDGTASREIIADTDSVLVSDIPSALGLLRRVDLAPESGVAQPAELDLVDMSLLFSDASVVSGSPLTVDALGLRGCPADRIVTFVREPFYVSGWTARGDFVFCTE